MDIRSRYVLIALGAVAVIVVLATLLLPRKIRLALYLVLILVAAGAAGYVTLVRNSLPSDYVLESYASGMSLPTFALPEPGDSNRMFVLEKFGKVISFSMKKQRKSKEKILRSGQIQLNILSNLLHGWEER